MKHLSRYTLTGLLLVVIAQAGFASKGIWIKLAYAVNPLAPVDAVTMLALRMLLSSPFFIAMALYAWNQPDAKPLSNRQKLGILTTGFVGYYLSSYLDFTGLQYVSAALERLTLFLYPTLVVLLSALFLKKPVSRIQAIALAVSYAGISLAFVHDVSVAGEIGVTLLGTSLVFAAALSYSVYLMISGELLKQIGSTRFTAYASLTATGFGLLHFFLTHPVSALTQSREIYGLGLTLAFASTVIPIWLLSEAISRLGASHVAIIGSFGPMLTIALGAILLDEQLSWYQLVGAALVLAGVLLVTLKRDAAPEIKVPAAD